MEITVEKIDESNNEIINDNDNIKELDDSWITKFDMENVLYQDFYTEEINNLQIISIYINSKNEISSITKGSEIIENNILEKPRLIKLLKEKMNHKGIKYKPLSILKYNIDLAPDDIYEYLKTPDEYKFLETQKTLNLISWRDSINLFLDLNTLYFIFYEKKTNKKLTKRIKIRTKNKKTKKKRDINNY